MKDVKEIESALTSYLTKKWNKEVLVSECKPLTGGACQENFSMLLSDKEANIKAVLRTDKGATLLSSLSKADEFRVAEAIFLKGVKTPKPILLESKSEILGDPFYLMEKIEGKATGRFIVKDPSIADYRKTKFAEDLARNLALLHSIEATEEQVSFLPSSLAFVKKVDYGAFCIENLRNTLDSLPEPHPAVELGLNWLKQNLPSIDKITLVHGDFRTGNFMVSPKGLEGILDFEFAHWGDPYEDIAWLCMRDWRFGKLNKEAGGFASRKEFYSAYENHSGQFVQHKRVLFWEIMGNLRWAVGSSQQAERHLSGKDKGIELLAIGRRTAEMEWEAIRLMEEYENAI